MTESEELAQLIIKEISKNPGITIEELAERLGEGKYAIYRIVKELVDEGVILAKRDEPIDPYRPTWTAPLYVSRASRESLHEDLSARKEDMGLEVSKEEISLSLTPRPELSLVLTHPRPSETALNYLTFRECFEVLASRGGISGVVGYVDSQTLKGFLGEVAQHLKRPFNLNLVATEIKGDVDRVKSILKKVGVKVDLRVPPWQQRGYSVHAKFLTTDLYAYVGSHNLLVSSLSTNLEVGILTEDPVLALELKKLFSEIWNEVL